MKTFTLLLMMVLGFTNAFNQDYYPLVSEGKLWNTLSVTENGPNPWDTVYETKTYKFEGDTVINNTNYLKIYESDQEIPVNWTFKGGIREENKKVWTVFSNGSDETILYDFSLNIGDTMVFDEGYVEMVVDTITMVNIGNAERQKYHLRYYNDPDIKETWIEGIGSNLGILTSGTEGVDGGGYWFLCMTENGGLVYMNPNYNSCFLISTGTKEIINPEINIFPNPANNILMIENLNHALLKSIKLVDLKGNIIKEFSTDQENLNLDGTKPGSYILLLETEKGIIKKKIIVN